MRRCMSFRAREPLLQLAKIYGVAAHRLAPHENRMARRFRNPLPDSAKASLRAFFPGSVATLRDAKVLIFRTIL
jgi:hypothetical protein